jgi:hypothetical protein
MRDQASALGVLTFSLGLLWAHGARAVDSCASAYEESQVARSEGRLRSAQGLLRSCTHVECAEFIRTDCARWLEELESAMPSVVLVAKADGAELHDVEVAFDGDVIAAELDGKAVPVDPGRHVLTFRRRGYPARELEIIIREGDKNRPVVAELEPPAKVAKPPPPSPDAGRKERGVGLLPPVLLGVGALGAAGFATLGLLGISQQHDLETSCSPHCRDSEVDAVHKKFVLADVSLAVSVLALAGSGYLFWSASSAPTAKPPASQTAVNASIDITPHGAACAARWSF